MKYIFLVTVLSICVISEAQVKPKEKAETQQDSVKHCPVNDFQLEVINSLQRRIEEDQKELTKSIELITGIKQSDMEKLDYKPGEFIVTLRRRKE